MNRHAFLSLGLIFIISCFSMCLEFIPDNSDEYHGMWLFIHNESSDDIEVFLEYQDLDWTMVINDTCLIEKDDVYRSSYMVQSGNQGFIIEDNNGNKLHIIEYYGGGDLLINAYVYDDEITREARS